MVKTKLFSVFLKASLSQPKQGCRVGSWVDTINKKTHVMEDEDKQNLVQSEMDLETSSEDLAVASYVQLVVMACAMGQWGCLAGALPHGGLGTLECGQA